MPKWDELDSFDRYDKLSDELNSVGDLATVVFQDDGRDVPSDVIQNALTSKGQKNIKARDSVVFHVKQDETNKDFEVWLSATSYTNLRELKAIRDANNGTLKDAKVQVKRMSKEDMTQTAFKFESA